MKRLAVFLSLLAASFIANAKVVAWYRFEETPSGTGTSGASGKGRRRRGNPGFEILLQP